MATVANVVNGGPVNIASFNGKIELKSTDYITLGTDETDGTWRFVRSGNNLVIQRYDTNAWVTKSTITA